MSLREQKAEKKKKDMIKSAVSIIEKKGYHNTTMEEIASQLLMTKGSVYYYFKNKQDLLYQSQKMLLNESITHIESINKEEYPVAERLQKTMIVHIKYLITERSGFAMGFRPEQFFSGEHLEGILELRNRYSQYVDQLLLEGMETGVFEAVDIKIVRNIILGAMNWVIEWYSPEGSLDKDALSQTISNYLLRILINK